MGAVVEVLVEAFLVIIILLLLGMILFSGGGIARRRELLREVNSLRDEVKRLQDANEALRGRLGIGAEARVRHFGDLFELVRDLEGLRCAIAGSSACRQVLTQKYGAALGPELLKRILVARPSIDSAAKRKLADELLVGEVGRSILRSLNAGALLEKAASDAGVPVVVARGQVKRLQILGYLDTRLKLTDRGREALA
jgi:hypothetical protein